MRSWYAIRARDAGVEVSIYDEIGAYGVSAKSLLYELGALPAEGPLTLRLNSPGGSVFDAVAIYNALKRRRPRPERHRRQPDRRRGALGQRRRQRRRRVDRGPIVNRQISSSPAPRRQDHRRHGVAAA